MVLVDANTGKELGKTTEQVFVPSMPFATSGKVLAVSRGNLIDVYDVPALKLRCSISVLKFMMTSVERGTMIFSADGQTLAAFYGPGALGIFDTTTGKKRSIITLSDRTATAARAFSPDGRTLALDLNDGTIAVWELASGSQRRVYGLKQAAKDQPRQASGAKGAAAVMGADTSHNSVSFSPSGKLLVQGSKDGKLHVWDVTTGRAIADLAGHSGAVLAVAFAPDGKTLVSGSADTTALLWEMASLETKATLTAKKLAEADLKARWAALAENDAGKAIDAIADLAACPEQSVPFLQTHLKMPPALDAKRAEKLIAELDDSQYKVRQNANSELTKLGEQVVPLLTKALAVNLPLEVRQRVETLRDQLSSSVLTGEALQAFRAIEVLELIGTPQARQQLQVLADGSSGTMLPTAARAALERNKR
jgi:hypothetical protein